MKNQPSQSSIMVINPYTGKTINMEPLFKLLSTSVYTVEENGKEAAAYINNTIRFINEETYHEGTDKDRMRLLFIQLYQLKDCFQAMV